MMGRLETKEDARGSAKPRCFRPRRTSDSQEWPSCTVINVINCVKVAASELCDVLRKAGNTWPSTMFAINKQGREMIGILLRNALQISEDRRSSDIVVVAQEQVVENRPWATSD